MKKQPKRERFEYRTKFSGKKPGGLLCCYSKDYYTSHSSQQLSYFPNYAAFPEDERSLNLI